MTKISPAIFLSLLVALVATASAFQQVVPKIPRTTTATTTTTSVNMFNKLGDAFKNDDALGERKNEGLKGGPKYNEQVTVNGKKVQGAVAGQKLTAVASKARVKIPVNCQKGDCGTCMVSINGRKVKGCQTALPSGKADIRTL